MAGQLDYPPPLPPLPPCPRQPSCFDCDRVSHHTSPPLIPEVHSSTRTSVDRAFPRRLINVRNLKLVHFNEDDPVPHYAILSHLWGFKDKKEAEDNTEAEWHIGQIWFACKQAISCGLHYLWDDTWCITFDLHDFYRDIVHMFSYYRNASVCYALLPGGSWESDWFFEGWTLQELLAPPEVFFFTNQSFLGTRTERAKEISDTTGISEDVLLGRISVYDVSVQERLSWARERITVYDYDWIHCLLGILGVSMQPSGGYERDFRMAFAHLREAFSQQHPNQVNAFDDGWVDMFCLRVRCSRHPSKNPSPPAPPPFRPPSRPSLLSCCDNEASSSSHENCPRRLINTHTFELVDTFEPVPHYAILSHRWLTGEEVDFWEFEHPTPETMGKSGYQKIVAACQEARRDGLDYLWVDSCCIDQNDLGDVHRNIKSMFAYYQNARICYAYLVDVNKRRGNFGRSVWFTRGWTLQELLAPPEVLFFSGSWEYLGTRTGRAGKIHAATGIPETVIKGTTPIRDIDVEERMTWSTPRTTSVPQDLAYCLFGILEVSIQPDYKEEVDQAFIRLQKACYEKYPHLATRFHVHDGGLFSTLLARFRERSAYRRTLEEERHVVETNRRTLEEERHVVEMNRRTLEEERRVVETNRRILEEERHVVETKRHAVGEERCALEAELHALEEARRVVEMKRHAVEKERCALEAELHALEEARRAVEAERHTLEV